MDSDLSFMVFYGVSLHTPFPDEGLLNRGHLLHTPRVQAKKRTLTRATALPWGVVLFRLRRNNTIPHCKALARSSMRLCPCARGACHRCPPPSPGPRAQRDCVPSRSPPTPSFRGIPSPPPWLQAPTQFSEQPNVCYTGATRSIHTQPVQIA
jgi:hypothetical protein